MIDRTSMKLSIKEHIVLTRVLNLEQKKNWKMICASLQIGTLDCPTIFGIVCYKSDQRRLLHLDLH